ncbi:MAG: hypothetical protein Q4A09_07080 [Capnocytophaga felis]|nr:hypothetical protein [Capnocytophaga felis]
MRIYMLLFVLLCILSCTDNKECEKISATIASQQDSVDMSFAKSIENKHTEIQYRMLDDKLSYEEKINRVQKSSDSLYKEAYQQLKENKTFKEKGLYGNISYIGRMILLFNKKYKKLDSLLQNNTCFTNFEDKILKEQITFLAHKTDDYSRAKKAIIRADKMIKDKLPKSPEEDTNENVFLYYHYVTNKAIFQGKETGYKAVDSLIKVHNVLKQYANDMKEQCDVLTMFMK